MAFNEVKDLLDGLNILLSYVEVINITYVKAWWMILAVNESLVKKV
jgi:hypothetical protein